MCVWVVCGCVCVGVAILSESTFLHVHTCTYVTQGFHGDDQSIPAVTINHGCFTWTTPTTTETTPTTTEGERVTLTDINLTIHPVSYTCIYILTSTINDFYVLD